MKTNDAKTNGYAARVIQNAKNVARLKRRAAAYRRLEPGAKVVSTADGEPGTVVRVATYRRNGIDAWSYLVDTKDGREVWDASELFVPATKQD